MAYHDPDPGHTAASRVVYDHSAGQYVDGVGTSVSARFEAPLDRAVLAAFAEDLAVDAPGDVVDVGCGPGRVASYLSSRGLETRGVDISPRMVEAARSAHPHLTFDVGALTDIPGPNGSVAGAVYWYSIITTPPSELALAWIELDRILRSDGHVLVAFQAGDNEPVERPDAYGSGTTLTLFRHSGDDVIASMEAAGFAIHADVRRRATLAHETTPQAFLFARRRQD